MTHKILLGLFSVLILSFCSQTSGISDAVTISNATIISDAVIEEIDIQKLAMTIVTSPLKTGPC